MKKKLISLATGTLLARFSAYTLYLLILTNMSHNFAITNRWNEIWSNIHTYVAELGCLALSFAIIIIFSFVTTKEKMRPQAFCFFFNCRCSLRRCSVQSGQLYCFNVYLNYG